MEPGQASTAPARSGAWTIVGAAAYPALAHAATVLGSPRLTLLSVVVLACVVLLPPLAAGRTWARLAAPAAVIAILVLVRADAEALVLFVPPILLNAYLAWLFGRTLVPGRTALIYRLVRLMHPPDEELDPDIEPYATRLTAAWAVLFTLLGLVNLLLALGATPGGLLSAFGLQPPIAVPRDIWSLFANVLNYCIVATFFLAEYAYRRRRFPQQPYRNLLDFIRRAVAAGPRLLAGHAVRARDGSA